MGDRRAARLGAVGALSVRRRDDGPLTMDGHKRETLLLLGKVNRALRVVNGCCTFSILSLL